MGSQLYKNVPIFKLFAITGGADEPGFHYDCHDSRWDFLGEIYTRYC